MARGFGLQIVPPPSADDPLWEGPNSVVPGPAEEALHLLTIALRPNEIATHSPLLVGDQLDWVARAEDDGASLVTLVSAECIELYSAEPSPTVAFRPALQALAKRVRRRPELGRARCASVSGPAAAFQFLRRTAQLQVAHPGEQAQSVRVANPRVVASGHLSASVAALLRAGADVRRRLREETSFLEPTSSALLLEVEALSAARIVEEALVAWQVLRSVDLGDARPPVGFIVGSKRTCSPGGCFPDETPSGIRPKAVRLSARPGEPASITFDPQAAIASRGALAR
jgi:hypothetical protein